MLGARPLLGRVLLPEEDKPGKPAVAILSYRLWKRLFNADPQIVGRSITLNGKPYTVAGVLQPGIPARRRGDARRRRPWTRWTSFCRCRWAPMRRRIGGDENYNLMVRLKPGVTIQQAQADIDIIASRIREKDKRDRTFGMTVIGLQDQVVGDVRRALLVLLGSVSLVLLIACANVANLLLTRAAGRQKELAIRTALGAGGWQILRQLLTESLLLAAMGGAAGLVIAKATLYVVRAINPGNIPRLEDIEINGTVLAFTFAVSLVTGILFGLAPAWRALQAGSEHLAQIRRTQRPDRWRPASRGNRLRGLLVVSELALSLILLAGAGLLIRSFVRLQAVPPGFATDHVLSMRVVASGPKYQKDNAVAQSLPADWRPRRAPSRREERKARLPCFR